MANIINEIKRSEDTLKASNEEYVVPSYPIELFPSDFKKPRFGKDMLKYFKLNKSITFLNHGSYGSLPIPIANIQRNWQDLIEENPVQFLSNNMFTYLYDTMRDVAKFINADAEDIVFVDNATSGCNTVLKSLKYKEGENIVYLNIEYGAIIFTIEYMASRYNLEKKMVKVDLPIDVEKVLQDFENAIDSNTKICVIDHLTSSTGVVLPIKRFIDIAHKKGTLILVDAAHAIGHVPIDIKDLDPDFYTSNFHKWLFAPRGSAFLYINKKYKDQIVPLTISHGQNYSLNSRFSFTGTRDYTPFLCLKSCFKFFEAIGGDEAHAYQNTLNREAYQLLITRFGTGGILTKYHDEYMGKFSLIKLPKSNVDYPGNSVPEKGIYIQNLLYDKYKIEIPFNVLNDEIYVRISAQVYNELSDYEYLANSILELFKIV